MNSSLTQRKIMLKLQPFIKSAVEIANDPELFQALLQLAGNASEISYERDISKVTESSGASLWVKHSGHTNRNIDEENNFGPDATAIPYASSCLCEWCKSRNFDVFDAGFRAQDQSKGHRQSTPYEGHSSATPSAATYSLALPAGATRDFQAVSGRTSEYITPPIDLSWQTYTQISGGVYDGLFREYPVDGPSFAGNMIPFTLSTTSAREEGTWGLVTADLNNDEIF